MSAHYAAQSPCYLNLPLELWQHVYEYLAPSDLQQGALVSKSLSLSLYCQSQIWARIDADDWVFEGIYQGLIRNAHLVRRVACSAKSQLQVLSGPQCQSLTHLDIEKMRFLSSTVLEQILEHNYGSLQSLRIRLDRTIFLMVAEKIARMKGLKELYLQHWDGIHQEALETVLECCPQVEVLSLGHNSLYPFRLENIQQDESLSKLPLRIRSLVLDGAVIFHDELVLNLASRCPDMESLCMQGGFGMRLSKELATSLAILCPRLQRVNFTQQSMTQDFFSTLFRVLPGLKEIKVAKSSLTSDDIQIMIQNCSPTLEILDIGYCTSLESRSVLSILLGCPRLQQMDTRGVDFNPREMESTDEWVCTKLKTLHLEILLPKRAHYAEGEPERIRNSLYRQLARLNRLESLQLGAGSRDRGVNILEMSLLTGLSSLSTLSRLQRLDIKRLNHAVRSAEVAWMLEHWPRLQAMGILLDTNADMELVRAVHKTNRDILVW
ncbi:hypothetical protein BG011_008063 [Mortierella polycephala]|uniref:F-box domain-containing protein n=1 Tax=Mortierella polycephala TaxID=41804 RepID=A0A9P6PPM9_9FUNG|nr:hypothetical protein BG011_008063 [Mortierella polycephala]